MGENGVQSTQPTLASRPAAKLRPIGKQWSQKTAKLPNPNDIETMKKHAGKLYFRPLPPVPPPEIMSFSADAFLFRGRKQRRRETMDR